MQGESVIVRPATPADVPGIALVHVQSWQTTYQGIFSQAALDGHTFNKQPALWTRVMNMPSLGNALFVAARGDDIVGFANVGPFRVAGPEIAGEGECNAIYLLRLAQRQGIGRRLFDAGASWLCVQGYQGMRCWVIEDNPAQRFYQRQGGLVVATQTFEGEGAPLTEHCYRFELLPGQD